MIALAAPVFAGSAKSPGSERAPSFRLPTRTGSVCSDSLNAKVVYVDFWASWCGPCRKSFPWLASMHSRYAAKGLVVVAINLDKKRELAEAFLEQNAAPFTVAFDPDGKIARAFDVSAMPSGFLIDAEGKLISSHVGYDAKETAMIESRIQEAFSK